MSGNAVSSSEPTHLSDSNEVMKLLGTFLFEENSILLWVHLIIAAACVGLIVWVYRFNPDDLPKGVKCAKLVGDILRTYQNSAIALLNAFGIGFMLFLGGVAFEKVPAIPSMFVQVATYMPTLVLTLYQLGSTYSAVRVVRNHIGIN